MTISSSDPNYRQPTAASRLRHLLRRGQLSERAAARDMEIDEKTFRRYCTGKEIAPRYVVLALERLVMEEVML